MGSQVDEVLDYERQMARLAIAQGKTNESMRDFRREVTQASQATGIARNDIMRGVGAYQALTGDTEGAARATETFARVAQATGSNVEDVARAAASLKDNLQIDPGRFEEMFSILNVQGKAGSVELKDFAQEIAALSATWKQFQGGTGELGATELGAAFQAVRKDVGSSSEAATRLQALTTSIVRNANKLEKQGIRVFDEDGSRRAFTEIIEDFRKANLHDTKLTKILGSSEARQALVALTGHWEDFRGLVNTTDVESIGRDMEQYLASPAGQAEAAMNRMKLAAAEAFTPERIEKFAAAMADASEAISAASAAAGAFWDGMNEGATFAFGNDEKLVSDEQLAWASAQSGEIQSIRARNDDGLSLGGTWDAARGQTHDLGGTLGLANEVIARRLAMQQAENQKRAERERAAGAAADYLGGGVGMDPAAMQRAIERAMQVRVAVNVAGGVLFDVVANNPKNRTKVRGR